MNDGLLMDEREEGYSSTQACGFAEVSYRQLDYWAGLGVIDPSIQRGRGSGTQRRFSETDICALRICGRLARLGAEVSALALVVREVCAFPDVVAGAEWCYVEAGANMRVRFGRPGTPVPVPSRGAWIVKVH